METIYFWQHTSTVTGRRVRTRHLLTEAEADAARTLMDPVRVEYGALAIEPVTCGHTMPSGLVRRADGAMKPSD